MTPGEEFDSSSADFFEQKYQHGADPWNFAGSAYEQFRYGRILAALEFRRYQSAFEPGCSIGTLTEKLSRICEHIEAIDFSPSAIATARQRCPDTSVSFRALGLPERLPLVGFDLIVLSEIGYYFTPDHWEALVKAMVDAAEPGTVFLGAHWLGHSPDHKMSGDRVHTILRGNPKLHLLHEESHSGFRLDRWERT